MLRLTHPESSYWVLPSASRMKSLGNGGGDAFCGTSSSSEPDIDNCGVCVTGVGIRVLEVFCGNTGRSTSVKINL